MQTHRNPKPARAVPPGATIRSELLERGISDDRFAEIIERPVGFVGDLLDGKAELTPDTALRLEAALEIPASFWIRYEAEYRLQRCLVDDALLSRIRTKAELR